MKIGGYNTSCMAIVIENLPVPLLLGMEFLKSNHAKIDLDKFEVSFSRNDQSIAIRLPKPHQPSHTLFFNSTQTNLPVEALKNPEKKHLKKIRKKHKNKLCPKQKLQKLTLPIINSKKF
ncbi:hypothetical protein JTB14_011852 [Gonioctena quinquepunctata]|nr:hypothetical protein JTB14_011852 [Gonioctena quinquepunctata]